MNIAVSAVVCPSRWFARAAVTMCVVLIGAAALLIHGSTTELHHSLALVCVLAGAAVGLFPLVRRNRCRIDVSGIGQLRLVDTSPDAAADLIQRPVGDSEVVQLLRGSTCWSWLMVLRLRFPSGRVTSLLIFPDSVAEDAFHALSVACRWAVARQASLVAQPADKSLPPD
jgi:hypothetical protein